MSTFNIYFALFFYVVDVFMPAGDQSGVRDGS
jgi:hypothetical protein